MTRPSAILDTALDAIGNTPLIRLDKIAKRMVEMAEQEGKLIPGKSVVIEPTSGNTGVFRLPWEDDFILNAGLTGIGLAMACAIKVETSGFRSR